MATKVVMPALGMAQETGKLLEWLVAEGEHVEQGELLMQIETDKVTVEIPAPASGTLANVTAAPGSQVRVGETIAQILAPGEPAIPPTTPHPLSPPPPSPEAMPQEKGEGDGGRGAASSRSTLRNAGERDDAAEMRPPASPKARRLAAERGIDLAALQGSGPDGAVIAADVLAQSPHLPVSGVRAFDAFDYDQRESRWLERHARMQSPRLPLTESSTPSTVWRVMAERTTASWTGVPHFYLMREVAASGLVEMRVRITAPVEKRSGLKPTYSDMLVKIVALVVRDHPRMNASWANGGIHMIDEVNIGLATATEEGLVVPVIRNADRLTIGEIAVKRQDLVGRAHAGQLRTDDISAGTFTITNLGMYNVDAFSAIINAPQAAILAVGRITDRVVPVNGQPAVRPMLILTLSCDHRVVDGVRGAQFLDDLANLIQEPWGLLA